MAIAMCVSCTPIFARPLSRRKSNEMQISNNKAILLSLQNCGEFVLMHNLPYGVFLLHLFVHLRMTRHLQLLLILLPSS